MLKIEVELRRPNHSYAILFEPGLGSNWQSEVEERVPAERYLVLIDANIARAGDIPPHGCMEEKWCYLWVEPGEERKNLEQYGELCEDALRFEIDRDAVVVAVGGGVTGDIAGFAAATLLRGLRFVQIPTSLLAQVDSSVGGKNGVNTDSGKNMVGTIHQPELVLIDPCFLDTLPRREYLAGLAEIVKTAVLDSRDFFQELDQGCDLLLSGNHGFISGTIARCCRVKTDYVMSDERDTGRRQMLNLGHTFGHVLEALAGYDGRVVHGEAVSAGMVLACYFSALRGGMPMRQAREVEDLLKRLQLPVTVGELGRGDGTNPVDWRSALAGEDAAQILAADKKAGANGINLVLPRMIGDCCLEKGFAPEDVVRFMREHVDGEW